MTYPIGSILLFEKYKLPTKEKNKYFIVIEQEFGVCNLLSMTTSKFFFSADLIKHGTINRESLASVYCFESGKVIGEKGFSFDKHTFVNHNSNIHEFSFEKLSQHKIDVKDKLIKDELVNLLYSFCKYRGISKKLKIKVENILDRICNNSHQQK
jgi:hypothetical protein